MMILKDEIMNKMIGVKDEMLKNKSTILRKVRHV